MSNYNQSQAYPVPADSHMVPPPPAGYPMKEGEGGYQGLAPAAAATQSRDGDGCWKGCCAGMWAGCCSGLWQGCCSGICSGLCAS